MNDQPPFWKLKPLTALSDAEWESLCDGCGKCCLVKLEDDESGEVHYTSLACRLLDPQTCRCGNYELRFSLVPQCVRVTPQTIKEDLTWMPRNCAYRRLAEGKDLPDWHPLVTGDPASTLTSGNSAAGWITPEYEVQMAEWEEYVVSDQKI